MVNHKFRVIGTCWVWAVSYASKTGQLGTWGIYGSEKKLSKKRKSLEKYGRFQSKRK